MFNKDRWQEIFETREWRDYFSQNEIWRNVFIYHRISVVYYKRIEKLAKEKDNEYSEETHKYIRQKCPMIIFSSNIIEHLSE